MWPDHARSGQPGFPGGFAPGALTVAFLIPAFTAAVLGGMTSLPGAFLGGVIVGVVEAVGTSAAIFDDIPGSAGTLLVFVVLLVVLTARPQGLLGSADVFKGLRKRLRRLTEGPSGTASSPTQSETSIGGENPR